MSVLDFLSPLRGFSTEDCLIPGLTPWAIFYRPSGAWHEAAISSVVHPSSWPGYACRQDACTTTTGGLLWCGLPACTIQAKRRSGARRWLESSKLVVVVQERRAPDTLAQPNPIFAWEKSGAPRDAHLCPFQQGSARCS